MEFTQYVLPHGKQKQVVMDVPENVETTAKALVEVHNCHFDIEILTTGIVSMTCERDELDDPILAIELSPNGPEIVGHVEKLVKDAMLRLEEMDA